MAIQFHNVVSQAKKVMKFWNLSVGHEKLKKAIENYSLMPTWRVITWLNNSLHMILKLAFLSQVGEKSRKYGNGLGKYCSKDFSSSKGYKPHPWLQSVVRWVKIRSRNRSLSCWLGVAFLSSIGISWQNSAFVYITYVY